MNIWEIHPAPVHFPLTLYLAATRPRYRGRGEAARLSHSRISVHARCGHHQCRSRRSCRTRRLLHGAATFRGSTRSDHPARGLGRERDHHLRNRARPSFQAAQPSVGATSAYRIRARRGVPHWPRAHWVGTSSTRMALVWRSRRLPKQETGRSHLKNLLGDEDLGRRLRKAVVLRHRQHWRDRRLCQSAPVPSRVGSTCHLGKLRQSRAD